MSIQPIYICNRCKKEARVDRSGWMTLTVAYSGNERDLCPECKEKFLKFMKQK